MLLIYMLDMSMLEALLAEGSKQVMVLYGTSDLVLYGHSSSTLNSGASRISPTSPGNLFHSYCAIMTLDNIA